MYPCFVQCYFVAFFGLTWHVKAPVVIYPLNGFEVNTDDQILEWMDVRVRGPSDEMDRQLFLMLQVS